MIMDSNSTQINGESTVNSVQQAPMPQASPLQTAAPEAAWHPTSSVAQPNTYAAGQPVYQQPLPPVAAPPVKQPKGWARMIAAFSLAFATLVIQGFAMIPGYFSQSETGLMTVAEIASGLAALVFIFALGGKKLATPSMEGMGETWRILRWLFLADAVVTVIDIIGTVASGTFELSEMWFLRTLLLLLMCIGVGLFEETMFRGLVFHGLLARMGGTKKGMLWAVILSSIIFGAMHIDPFNMSWSDPMQVLQALLKIVQTGIFGFVTAVAVLRTGNIWPVVLIHCLNDFMLMFVYNGLSNMPITTEYVSTGEDALAIVGIYIALSLAYVPSLIAAIRTFRTHPVPDRGQFYRARAPLPTYAPAPMNTYQQ